MPVFVQNGVNKIRRQKQVTFGYIPSESNLADLATRGLTISELKNWWHGPTKLRLDEHCWPSWNLPDVTPKELKQMLIQVKRGFESSCRSRR